MNEQTTTVQDMLQKYLNEKVPDASISLTGPDGQPGLFIAAPGFNLKEITAFFEQGLGNAGLNRFLPQEDALSLPLDTIWLDSLSLEQVPDESKAEVQFTLSWKENITLLDELTLKEIRISFDIGPWWETAVLEGLLQVKDAELVVRIELPSLVLRAIMNEDGQGNDSLLSFLPNLGKAAPILKDVELWAALRIPSVRFHFTVDNLLDGLPLEIHEMQVDVMYIGGLKGDWSGRVWGDMVIDLPDADGGPLELLLAADIAPEGNWRFSGGMGTSGFHLGALLAHLADKFKVENLVSSAPQSISSLEVVSLALEYDHGSQDFNFTCQLEFEISADEPPANVSLSVTLAHEGDAYTHTFSGEVMVGRYRFDLYLDGEWGKSETLVATFQPQESLDIQELIGGVLNDPNMLKLLPHLTLSIKDVLLAITKGTPSAEPTESEVDQGMPAVQKRTVLFGLALDASLSLLDLPLLGDLPGGGLSGGIDNLQVLYANQGVTGEQVHTLNSLLPDGTAPLPSASKGDNADLALNKGFNFAADLYLDNLPFTLSTAGKEPAVDGLNNPGPGPGTPKTTSDLSGSPPPNASVKWIGIQKGIGPIYLQKIGVRYESGKVWFLLNADLTIAGLTISLNGLGISSALQAFAPTFHLQGLGIDYRESVLEIGGTFLHLQSQDAQGQPIDEYNGMLLVSAEDWSLTAIGSYASLQGHPSLFAYLALNYPLGGPSFFFITGLAAGFGYNRRLIPPPAEQVAQFPLVAQAMGSLPTPPLPTGSAAIRDTLSSQMVTLSQYIPPTLGEYFLAVGISFTSFELIHGFMLVTAEFGQRFVLNLIGLLSYATPSDLEPGTPALIQAELGITATFDPEAGFLGMRAVLTNNSYLYDPACHLTGGMAFYSWFSGEHAGEFVLTVGGYHPHFQVPDYYPQVPRLSVNWQVNEELSIQGSAYFALTGHAFMAGGSLAAVWHSSDYKAWFIAAADFLIQWKPYHYEASLHLEIGASATLHAFGTHTVSASLGADLDIWGPKFAGYASVDFALFSIDITFGPDKQQPSPLNYAQFRQAFLPSGDNQILTVSARGGLVKELHGMHLGANGQPDKSSNPNERLWLFNARHFHLALDSVIPINTWHFGEKSDERAKNFSIAPMDLPAEQLNSTLQITIDRFDENGDAVNLIDVSGEFLPDDENSPVLSMDRLLITKPMPAGMWGTRFQPALNGQAMISGLLTGFHILPGTLPAPGITHEIERKNLSFEQVLHAPYFKESINWTAEPPVESESQTDDVSTRTVASNLLSHFISQSQIAQLDGCLTLDELLLPLSSVHSETA